MSHSNVALRDDVRPKRGYPGLERWLLRQIFKAIGPAPLRLMFKDGEAMCPPGTSPTDTIIIRDLPTLARMMIDPEVAFGDAYAEGRIEIEGDLVRALEAVYKSWPQGRANASWYQKLTSKWMAKRQENSLYGSRHNVHLHYDLGNEFYKLWLDRDMVYTCAYFPSSTATLEQAQEAKLEYICRKLHLQKGERVVEAGCGWGSMALYMAQHYGVTVKAYNISHEQILYARKRASELGLSDKVEFVEDDWRNITGLFDVFVSVGMLEHVSTSDYSRMSELIHRSIGDGGRGLLHFVGRSYPGAFSRWIRKRIFPGAYAPTLAEAMAILQNHRYAVLDVENLRPHYARTVELWLERFEAARDRVCEMYGPWFQRAWRLYLAGSIAGFRTGTLQLFQVSFEGAESRVTAWTRAALYRDSKPSGEDKWIATTS